MTGQVLRESSIVEAVREAVERAPKRRFLESVDVSIVMRGIDLKRNPNLRFDEVIELPNPPKGKPSKVAVIGKGDFALRAKEGGADAVFSPEDIETIAKSKRELRKLANRFDFFVAQADVIPRLARILGPIFGPRGKMPIPLPATQVDRLPATIERLKRSVRGRMRGQPVFHLRVGTRDMDPKEIAENIEAVLSAVERKYGDLSKVDAIYVKTTMGPPVRVELGR